MARCIAIVLICWVCGGMAFATNDRGFADSPSLLINGGFEDADEGASKPTPKAWKAVGNIAGVDYIWEKKLARSGSASLGFRKSVNKFIPVAQWTQQLKHDPKQSTIEVSGWIKAEKAHKAIIDVQFEDSESSWSYKRAVYIGAAEAGDPPADHDWKLYKGAVNIPPQTRSLRISLQMWGPGTVLFDDLAARYVDPVPDEPKGVEDGKPNAKQFEGEDLRAGGDENKRFFLFGPRPGAATTRAGFKLLLVLPGGDGSAEFNGFIANIQRQSLSIDYIVAQLVAPQWNKQQAEKLVWPRQRNAVPEAKFTTEEFINEVIKEVKQRHAIDERSIFALGWSSSGPPLYEATLTENSPIAAAFIAMSVFPQNTLPPLKGAEGKAFYLLHSPQDRIPISQSETAQDVLREAGATVDLQTYSGGHGWHGDIFGMIRTGMQWLEEQNAAKSKESNGQNPK